MGYSDAAQALIESFKVLAEEVQTLIDRKTILEHKLRYAHEQYQSLADKYAPAVPEVSETLAKLQLPPDVEPSVLTSSSFVPLPPRSQTTTRRSQHQVAVLIREGRRAANQLAALAVPSRDSRSSKETHSPLTDTMTSLSNNLEHDFTVEGKPSRLACPFSQQHHGNEDTHNQAESSAAEATEDPTRHHAADPICAALYEDSMSALAPRSTSGSATAAKCPIRFMDQHSPEEIARYVETHKHEIPRSHEVCVRRYQKNQEQIRKLDAKYGNLVSMIKDLSQLHQPMLQSVSGRGGEGEGGSAVDAGAGAVAADPPDDENEPEKMSNERVENWAQQVSSGEGEDGGAGAYDGLNPHKEEVEEREGHFNRPLKEVRVGESPSRPWGISVPVQFNAVASDGAPQKEPVSPPPAPVPHVPILSSNTPHLPPGHPPQAAGNGKCPFSQLSFHSVEGHPPPLQTYETTASLDPVPPEEHSSRRAGTPRHMSPDAARVPRSTQPVFVHGGAASAAEKPAAPSMVFTGPVFIGYPVEQAIQLMQHFQGST